MLCSSPPPSLKKHRTRQQLLNHTYSLLLLIQAAAGIFLLLHAKEASGWYVLGFVLVALGLSCEPRVWTRWWICWPFLAFGLFQTGRALLSSTAIDSIIHVSAARPSDHVLAVHDDLPKVLEGATFRTRPIHEAERRPWDRPHKPPPPVTERTGTPPDAPHEVIDNSKPWAQKIKAPHRFRERRAIEPDPRADRGLRDHRDVGDVPDPRDMLESKRAAWEEKQRLHERIDDRLPHKRGSWEEKQRRRQEMDERNPSRYWEEKQRLLQDIEDRNTRKYAAQETARRNKDSMRDSSEKRMKKSESSRGPPPLDPSRPFGFTADLKNATEQQVIQAHPKIFEELPDHFDERFKSPCWTGNQPGLQCLPYAYILGLPKCGSSDLWERINYHPQALRAARKEVRFFTRGEFSRTAPPEGFIPPGTSITDFTRHHSDAARQVEHGMSDGVIIDGGPHTLWWSIQNPDGTAPENEVPIPFFLKHIHATPKFIVSLADPVRRMYSDYYFLTDHSVAMSTEGKSPQLFHDIAAEQIQDINTCFSNFDPHFVDRVNTPSLHAQLACAYDRYHFGRPGTGRIAIGMYYAFLARWFQVFAKEQFLILRLEDFNSGDPKEYYNKVFEFLHMREPNEMEWKRILVEKTFNEHRSDRDPILSETEHLLQSFFQPFCRQLASLLDDPRFTWEDVWKLKNIDSLVQPRFPRAHHVHERDRFPDHPPPLPRHHEMEISGRDSLLDMPVERILEENGGYALCAASMGLHEQAMERMLSTSGVDASARSGRNHDFTALHCLSLTWIYGDSLRESYILALLGNRGHWMDAVLDPPAPKGRSTYSMHHVVRGVDQITGNIAAMLLDAGANPNAVDPTGKTPLHYASKGGLTKMVKKLLEAGASPHIADRVHFQTPAHAAALEGHAEILQMLIHAGANVDVKDEANNSPASIARAVGSAIQPHELKAHLGWEKEQQRTLPPESVKWVDKKYENSGWATTDLAGDVSSAACDVDMLLASQTTAQEIFEKYLMMNRPVLIRQLNENSSSWEAYRMDQLKERFGSLSVHVSDIPYNTKFGSPNGEDMRLDDYLKEMKNSTISGGKYPWYVFKGNPIPLTISSDSVVSPTAATVPQLIFDVFNRYPVKRPPKLPRHQKDDPSVDAELSRRKPFVNMQWALGATSTGAPVHFHNTAWNSLFYGKKHWLLYPPSRTLMGKKQVKQWVDEDVEELKQEGFVPYTCTQQPGDILIVPELWGHAVLNVRDSIAIATEVSGSLFRPERLPSVFREVTQMRDG